MNQLPGEIESIETKDNLSLVSVKVGTTILSAIVIKTPQTASYLKIGNPIQVIFKATEVTVGLGYVHHISLQNRLAGEVVAIESGQLLSRLALKTSVGMIFSIITTKAVNQLQLRVGSKIMAMVKTNEVMLTE